MGVSCRKTFPSQHATLSAFAAVYVSVSAVPHPRCAIGANCPDHPPVPRQMYFNSVISDTTKLLKPILVFSFAIAAGVCGLTQITQYRSHPVDVYAGFLIGAGIAAYLVRGQIGRPEGEGQRPLPRGMLPFSPLGATGRLSRAQTCQMCKVTRSQNLSCGEKGGLPLSHPQGMSVAWWGPWSPARPHTQSPSHL